MRKKLKTREILVEINTEKEANNLLAQTRILNLDMRVTPHQSLNSPQGYVRQPKTHPHRSLRQQRLWLQPNRFGMLLHPVSSPPGQSICGGTEEKETEAPAEAPTLAAPPAPSEAFLKPSAGCGPDPGEPRTDSLETRSLRCDCPETPDPGYDNWTASGGISEAQQSHAVRVQNEPYMVYPKGYERTNNILFFETLKKFNEHVKTQDYFDGSDVVFLLTARNSSRLNGNIVEPWYGGFAYIGAACTEWKVGLSEEQAGSFFGVFFFAHEVAHSLGCAHDGRDPENWPAGLIGAKDCSWDDGLMMSYKYNTPHKNSFSECCQREVLNLYIRPAYECLRKENTRERGVYSSRFPGEVSSRQTFCRNVYHQYKFVEVDRKHNMTDCIVKCYIDKKKNSMLIGAVDGVTCGRNKVCAVGKCIDRSEISKLE
ncbi:metalloprotease mig-17-like [Haemaphysalis longicornis]